MSFQPAPEQPITIDNATYTVATHPAARNIPYGQEGRQATVYQLVSDNQLQALKVFKARYRVPALVMLAERMVEIANMPGLCVCTRTVLTPRRHTALLREHPDLTYAVLMPWVEGPTWLEVVLKKQAISAEISLGLAQGLLHVLGDMEERGLAHCDLSGSNLLLPSLTSEEKPEHASPVELVDTEQMFSPNFTRPEVLPAGSPGYAHQVASQGLWSASADRFAGAILVAELLGWCDQRVREAAWGESYFAPDELQLDSTRAQLLRMVLHEIWGSSAALLFERAWQSDTLQDCPTLGEWLIALPTTPISVRNPVEKQQVQVENNSTHQRNGEHEPGVVQLFLGLGKSFEQQGNIDSAIKTYRYLMASVPDAQGSIKEIADSIARLRASQSRQQLVPASPAGMEASPPESSQTAVRDGVINSRNANRIKLLHTLTTHSNVVSSVAFHPSGDLLASASWDCTVAIWERITLKITQVLKLSAAVLSIKFSPDGSTLATACLDGKAYFWDVRTWQPFRVIPVSTLGLTCVEYSPDGESLMASSIDNRLYLWSVRHGTKTRQFEGHSQMIRCARFSPDGRTIASGSDDKEVLIWDTRNGDLMHALRDRSGGVSDVAFSSNSAMLASATSDGRLRLWQLGDPPKLLARLDGEKGTSSAMCSVLFSHDNTILLGGTADGEIVIWSLSDYRKLGKLSSDDRGSVDSLALAPDGRLLASAQDHTVKLWSCPK